MGTISWPTSVAGHARAWGLLVGVCLALLGPAHADWRAKANADFANLAPYRLILLGEQHDAAQHHALQTELVTWLIARQGLAALVLEMADQGQSTTGLDPAATDAQVQTALGWSEIGWPWADYGPTIMAAVRAGVPVLGANLPRQAMRAAMQNAALEASLSPEALNTQDERMRSGHCGLLPESQIRPMTRIQIARDQAMAQTMAQAWAPTGAVLLLAGNGHVDRRLGVPVHMGALAAQARVITMQAGSTNTLDSQADLVWPTPALPPKDYCAGLRAGR